MLCATSMTPAKQVCPEANPQHPDSQRSTFRDAGRFPEAISILNMVGAATSSDFALHRPIPKTRWSIHRSWVKLPRKARARRAFGVRIPPCRVAIRHSRRSRPLGKAHRPAGFPNHDICPESCAGSREVIWKLEGWWLSEGRKCTNGEAEAGPHRRKDHTAAPMSRWRSESILGMSEVITARSTKTGEVVDRARFALPWAGVERSFPWASVR